MRNSGDHAYLRGGPVDGDVFDRRSQNLADVVIKKVLVHRVVAQDKATTANETELADDIFGHFGDAVNLQSQFKACSYDHLLFNAVYLPNTVVPGAADSTIRNAAVNTAKAQLSSLTSIANHVMVCVPPDTSGGWIACAYINQWLSVYNDK